MEIVFQDYLAGALRRQLAGRGQIKSQDCYALDVDGRLTRKPDVTFWRDGTCVAIADAKYRRREQTNFSADINQIVTYCTTRAVNHGHLIYVDARHTEEVYKITGTNIEIHVRSLDLSQHIPGLEADISELASEMAVAQRPPAGGAR
jgi:5-methylcytosine-specific restriction enzyme subunit McrC